MKPFYENSGVTLYLGDALECLRELPDESVNGCITSPPYWGLRDYGTAEWEGGDAACDHKVASKRSERPRDGLTGGTAVDAATIYKGDCGRCGARRIDLQLGLEQTPDEYVARLVGVFAEVRRVLRDDGTLWLNLGDSYAGSWGAQSREHAGKHAPNVSALSANQIIAAQRRQSNTGSIPEGSGLKPKDLVMIPARVALALRADGWYLRSDIIWAKPAPMPESVTDRPTRSHEYIFLLAKSERYFYDAGNIREPFADDRNGNPGTYTRTNSELGGRNKRDVWVVNTDPFPEAHFATFPPALILPCVLAGCPAGGTVLDPFSGAGTTALVAKQNGRKCIGIELNEDYLKMSARRLSQEVLDLVAAEELPA